MILGGASQDAVQRFADELDNIYRASSLRTYETLAKALMCSRTTATAILNGERFPEKDLIPRFIEACAGNASQTQAQTLVDRLYVLWEDAQEARRSEKRGRHSKQSMGPLEAVPILGFTKSSLPVTWYRNNSEFYGAAADYVRSAKSSIRVTYVRQTPPSLVTSPEAKAYFQAILDWASEPGAHGASRILGVPEIDGTDGTYDESLLDWARLHEEETRDIINYEVRVMGWSNRSDGLNMALFDDDTVFFAISGKGSRQHLSGCSFTSAELLDLMVVHFDQLWGSLLDLSGYLRRLNPPIDPS